MRSLTKTVRWVLAVCCLAYIVYFFAKNQRQLAYLARLDLGYLRYMVALSAAGQLIYSVRYRIMLAKCSAVQVPLPYWIRLVLLGRFLNLFVPQAGNIYRGLDLKRRYGITYTHYASSFFSFIWMDTFLNTVYSIVLAGAVMPGLMLGPVRALWLLGGLAVTVASGPPLAAAILARMRFRRPRLVWLHGRLSEMVAVSVGSARDGSYIAKIVLWGAAAFAASTATFYFGFRSLNTAVSLPAVALFYILLKLSNEVLITPGNIGVREVAFGALSELMGMGMGPGIAVCAVTRVIGSGVVVLAGGCMGGFTLLRSSAPSGAGGAATPCAEEKGAASGP